MPKPTRQRQNKPKKTTIAQTGKTPTTKTGLEGIPENQIITNNPFDETANQSINRKPAKQATNQLITPTEKEFQETFIEVAQAAGWKRRFHVIDQGPNSSTRRMITELRQAGMKEAAEMVARIGYRRVTAKGFPDWNLCHDIHGIIVAELKSDRPNSKADQDQMGWLVAFAKSFRPPDNPYAPSRAHLWRPQHWQAIETQLYATSNPAHCHCDICEAVQNDR